MLFVFVLFFFSRFFWTFFYPSLFRDILHFFKIDRSISYSLIWCGLFMFAFPKAVWRSDRARTAEWTGGPGRARALLSGVYLRWNYGKGQSSSANPHQILFNLKSSCWNVPLITSEKKERKEHFLLLILS